jgi:murein tripeptide amidase MpaA
MKKFWLTFLLLSLLLAPTAAAGSTPNSVVARVYYGDPATLQSLANELDVWEVQPTQGYLVALLTPTERERLEQAGLHVEVDAARTSHLEMVPDAHAQAASGIPGYSCYRTVEETFATLQSLAATYPSLAQVSDVGDSWRKQSTSGAQGYDLWLLRLTNSARTGPKPRFFLMAEIHAREYVTAETATRFAEYLLQNYGHDPEVTWLLDENEIYILPMANPDGRKQAEAGILWRKNVDPYTCSTPNLQGVDLNRNSSFHWGGEGSSADACNDLYRGPVQASEPEVQSIQTLLSSLYPDRRGPLDTDLAPLDTEGMFITLHSYSGLVLWPYGWGDVPAPNDAQLATLGRKLAFFNGYIPQQASDLYAASGGADDWVYGELGVAAFTFEMGNNFFEACSNFETAIWPTNRTALLAAAKAARRPYQTPAGPDVTALQLEPVSAAPMTGMTFTALASDNRYAAYSGEPFQPIQAARYSIDSPSWTAGQITFLLSPKDGVYNDPVEELTGLVDTHGLSIGRHILFVEAQDTNGVWGSPSAIFLDLKRQAWLPIVQSSQ